jgi:hypothetical protein
VPAGVKRFLCDNPVVVPPLRPVRACVLAAATVVLVASPVAAGRSVPALPSEIPAATRQRLAPVTERAAVAMRVEGTPFRARPEVFEYLLDHPDFATHVTRAIKSARYRIWPVPGGFGIDDGWGTVGTFELVHVAPGLRVMHARGEYKQRVLPSIRGQAVVTISYAATPTGDGRSTIATAVDGYVTIDNAMIAAAGRLASAVAHAKAEKEGHRLVKVFARTARAIEENPAAVLEALQQRPDVPPRELEEFRRLLTRPPPSDPAAAAQH